MFRRIAAGAALLSLTLGVAACGSSDSPSNNDTPAKTTVAGADTTAAAKTTTT